MAERRLEGGLLGPGFANVLHAIQRAAAARERQIEREGYLAALRACGARGRAVLTSSGRVREHDDSVRRLDGSVRNGIFQASAVGVDSFKGVAWRFYFRQATGSKSHIELCAHSRNPADEEPFVMAAWDHRLTPITPEMPHDDLQGYVEAVQAATDLIEAEANRPPRSRH